MIVEGLEFGYQTGHDSAKDEFPRRKIFIQANPKDDNFLKENKLCLIPVSKFLR